MPDDSNLIGSLVAAAGVNLAGSVIKDARPGNHYFAIVSITRDDEGRQRPSLRTLEDVRLNLRAQNYEVDFVFSDPLTVDVEAGLRAALATAYGETVASSAVAFHARQATVWVELADAVMSPAMIEAVEAKVHQYFASFDVREPTIHVSSRSNLPSVLACLRLIRQLAPVDPQTLSNKLQAMRFNIPSGEWLSHRLDAMRRSGRIVRLRDGTYTLTADALQKLGTTKLRTSPDVSRMLALARRSR